MFSRVVFCLIIFFSNINYSYAKSKQPIKVPEIMKGPDGYFDPQIKVYSTVDSGNVTLRPKDCKYIFPTNTRGYTAFCHDNCFDNSSTCDDWKYNQSNTHNKSCMCATQTTVCGPAAISNVIDLGCIKIPNPPPPPTFYDQFPMFLEPYSVPLNVIQGNTYITPKIKVIIDSDYHELTGDKNTNKFETLFFPDSTGSKFSFNVTTDETQICASYLGTADGLNSSSPIKKQDCFEYPGPRKPSGLDYVSNNVNNIITISNNPDNVSTDTIHPKVVLNAADQAQCNNIHCKIGDFIGGFICKKDTNISAVCEGGVINDDLNCNNGKPICPVGYLLTMKYTQDPVNSKMLCLDGWESRPARYTLTNDHENKVFTETRSAFVGYVKVGDEWKRSSDSPVHIQDGDQVTLDSVKSIGSGLYSINGKNYKYEKIRYFCQKNDIANNHCNSGSIIKVPDGQDEANYKETNFINLGGTPYFLPDDSGVNEYSKNKCGNTLCYIKPNLYAEDLCVFKIFPGCFVFKTVYSAKNRQGTKNKKGTKSTKNKSKKAKGKSISSVNSHDITGLECDFMKVEAIGGGSSGNAQSSNTFSGSSGGYVSVNVLKDDFSKYKIVFADIGNGGINNNEPGKDTIVYLCNTNPSSGNNQDLEESLGKFCKKLITAKGGLSNKGVAANNDPIGTDFKGKLTYIKNFLGVPGKDAEPDHEPKIPKPNILGSLDDDDNYVDYNSTLCTTADPDITGDPCKEGFQESKNDKFFGMGGCASKDNTQIFPGMRGAVKLTCEIWRK